MSDHLLAAQRRQNCGTRLRLLRGRSWDGLLHRFSFRRSTDLPRRLYAVCCQGRPARGKSLLGGLWEHRVGRMSCPCGLKTGMIRLRVIPCSRLRSRERMLPGPSHVCLPEARGRFPSEHRKPERLHRKMWLRWLHFTNSKVGRDVAGHLYIIGGATLRR
jgi:hypothetical protein